MESNPPPPPSFPLLGPADPNDELPQVWDFGAFLGPSVRAPGLLPGVSEASGGAAGVTNALGLISQPPVSPLWLPETATAPTPGPQIMGLTLRRPSL